MAWLKAMAWDLRTNIEDETERALLAARLDPAEASATLGTLYPGYPFERNPVIVPKISTVPSLGEGTDAATATYTAPSGDGTSTATVQWQQASSVVEAAGLLLGGIGEGIGSNSWVVSGQLTETGLPLLANDPHLGAALPSVWYQVQLKCATASETCPFDVGGFSFAGLPGVIIGHNADIAWGFTNLTTDVADLYVEKVEGDQYWRDGALVPMDVRHETIRVAGGGDMQLTIRSTVHGPIASALTGDFTSVADDPVVGSLS